MFAEKGAPDERRQIEATYARLETVVNETLSLIADALRESDPSAWALANFKVGDALLELHDRARMTRVGRRIPHYLDIAQTFFAAGLGLDEKAGLSEAERIQAQSKYHLCRAHTEGAYDEAVSLSRKLRADASDELAALVRHNLAQNALGLSLHPRNRKPEVLATGLEAARQAVAGAKRLGLALRTRTVITLAKLLILNGDREEASTYARAAIDVVSRADDPEAWMGAHLALGDSLLARQAPIHEWQDSSMWSYSTWPELFDLSQKWPVSSADIPVLTEAIEAYRAALDVGFKAARDFSSHYPFSMALGLGAAWLFLARAQGEDVATMLRRSCDQASPGPISRAARVIPFLAASRKPRGAEQRRQAALDTFAVVRVLAFGSRARRNFKAFAGAGENEDQRRDDELRLAIIATAMRNVHDLAAHHPDEPELARFWGTMLEICGSDEMLRAEIFAKELTEFAILVNTRNDGQLAASLARSVFPNLYGGIRKASIQFRRHRRDAALSRPVRRYSASAGLGQGGQRPRPPLEGSPARAGRARRLARACARLRRCRTPRCLGGGPLQVHRRPAIVRRRLSPRGRRTSTFHRALRGKMATRRSAGAATRRHQALLGGGRRSRP